MYLHSLVSLCIYISYLRVFYANIHTGFFKDLHMYSQIKSPLDSQCRLLPLIVALHLPQHMISQYPAYMSGPCTSVKYNIHLLDTF